MIVLLRFIGLMNAAVWFGATVFFFLGVTPASFSNDLRQLLKGTYDFYSALIDQVYWERFLSLQIWCGTIALVHQLAEWLYLGRRFQRFTTWLVLALLSLALLDGLWLQPRFQKLHQVAFGYRKTAQGYEPNNILPAEDRLRAAKVLNFWRSVGHTASLGLTPGPLSLTANWLVLVGLALLTWRIANPGDTLRFVPTNKFRS